MAERGRAAARWRAAATSQRCWSLACLGVALVPMLRYEYLVFIVPAWTPHIADSAPLAAEGSFILLLLSAFGTAVGASIASALSIASYQNLAKPRPRRRFNECVVITSVPVIATCFLIGVAIYVAFHLYQG